MARKERRDEPEVRLQRSKGGHSKSDVSDRPGVRSNKGDHLSQCNSGKTDCSSWTEVMGGKTCLAKVEKLLTDGRGSRGFSGEEMSNACVNGKELSPKNP